MRWSGSDLLERRLGRLADLAELARAARVEDAARRRVRGARDLALEPDPLAPHAVDRRHGREQRLGVRVVRPVEDRLGRAQLHQPAEVEHGDAVGQVADDAEVVRDEDVGDLRSRWRSASRFRIAACTETSSADVGSSQTTRRGSPANARAIATRCLRPPESAVGRTDR